ncbi:hypothetical protein H1P_100026 [Hyella patelloides LEGE 07179]|uniref:Uncharacterized protein n=1 Tax=Hyella patelloides LEGE 07179 TaxID=945734 RepID=A0A563VIS6_9CYAN|nr:hypothetical protein [Hyella patelloides]VEP11322.1 hypothetical protein H1P_100026 [Hyella patelloides LEGE 07179]
MFLIQDKVLLRSKALGLNSLLLAIYCAITGTAVNAIPIIVKISRLENF